MRKKLEKHLISLQRQGFIAGWHDRLINAGTQWEHEIDAHLNEAHIILLLISGSFLASTYCYSIEMKRALERHEAGEARVIPVILRPVYWQDTPFSRLQVLPTNSKPIASSHWRNQDEAFTNVVEGIKKVVTELREALTVGYPSRRMMSSSSDAQAQDKGVDKSSKGEAKHGDTKLLDPSNVFFFNQRLPDVSEFYGRVRERLALLDRTAKGASTSIVGPRRIGKTWLMSYLQLMARKELGSRFLIGYLDATEQRCATVADFVTSALEKIALQKRTFANGGEGLLVLEQVVQELYSKNRVPVLCIDEFEGFGNRQEFDLHFFIALRAMTQNGLCLVVASKSPLIDVVGDYGKTSGFFNVFKQYKLEAFSSKEAEEFVQSKGDQAGLIDQEREQILYYGQTGRGEYWPIRLQLVGETLLEDKILAIRDADYYRPEDPDYWQDFERRVEESYRGVVH
jgi:hypothetical protein